LFHALTRCQKEGLVKITVVQPTNIFVSLEKAIEEQFGIRQAIVVDVGEIQLRQVKHAIGSAAAHYVETRLRPEDLWGSLLEQHHPLHGGRCIPQNIRARVFSFCGVGPNGNVQATILTQQLAAHLAARRGCCRRRVLSTPLESAPAGKQPGRRGGGRNLPKWMWPSSVLANWSRRSC
jgi:DNA-binding transcriptional regulator LsrR (DeoR family)